MVVGSPTKLNLIPSGVMPVVYINQGDAGYDKEFLVYNGDSPYNVPAGVSATIRGKKADGYGVTEAAALTEGSNLVTVTITEQMVAAAGANLYELVFVDTDGLRIATINMVWAVKADALGDAVISDSDLNYVNEALDKIQNADALKVQIDTNAENIAAEKLARIAADNAEILARDTADRAIRADIATEATARTSADTSLQQQINQLVAPTGAAPSAAEIENARIGANGITYSTLGDAIRGQITDLDTDFNDQISMNYSVPKKLTLGSYVNTLEMSKSVMTTQVIPAGSYIDSVIIHSGTTTSSEAYVFVFNEDNVCINKATFTCVNGENIVPLKFYADVNCMIGTYGSMPLYKTGAAEDDYVWSRGLYNISPKNPNFGAAISTSIQYPSSTFSLAVFAIVFSGVSKAIATLNNEEAYDNHVMPDLYENIYRYNVSVSGSAFVVSGLEYEAGTFIKAIKYYSTGASQNVYLYVIDKATSSVKFFKYTSAVSGWNVEPINYHCQTTCIIGIYGALLVCQKGTTTSGIVDNRKFFSVGLLTADIKPATTGDVLTITQTDADYIYAFPIQVIYTAPPVSDYEIRNIVPTLPVCLASFIDDDAGINTPTIWGEIIGDTNIRMGFACIAGVMAGEVEPTIQTNPMTLAQLKTLYNAGHEVYSHSWSHVDFEYASTTVDMIVQECYKSKDWLLNNGFFRGSDVIVYPGGLGVATTAKQNAVKQFFKYGVDAWGGGLNPAPINKTRIVRINADTASLESMKASVDKAVSDKCLIVFMNHSYEMISDTEAQIAKMESLITYIKGLGVEILPLREALARIYN